MRIRLEHNKAGTQWYAFRCPGCDDTHSFTVGPGGWSFNDNVDRPTIHPSLLVRTGHYCSNHKPGDRCWCTYNAEHPGKPAPCRCYRCHSYIKDGRIQFLPDCTHALAGQTVDLSEIKVDSH